MHGKRSNAKVKTREEKGVSEKEKSLCRHLGRDANTLDHITGVHRMGHLVNAARAKAKAKAKVCSAAAL